VRRLVVQAYCGVEWAEDRREVDAVFSETITMRGITRNLDLCVTHAEIDVTQLYDLLVNYGTRVTQVEEAPKEPKGKKAAAPATPEPITGGLFTLACDVEGCDFVTKATRFPQTGLGSHKAHAHGIAGKTNKKGLQRVR
jgi:hypothetical protein